MATNIYTQWLASKAVKVEQPAAYHAEQLCSPDGLEFSFSECSDTSQVRLLPCIQLDGLDTCTMRCNRPQHTHTGTSVADNTEGPGSSLFTHHLVRSFAINESGSHTPAYTAANPSPPVITSVTSLTLWSAAATLSFLAAVNSLPSIMVRGMIATVTPRPASAGHKLSTRTSIAITMMICGCSHRMQQQLSSCTGLAIQVLHRRQCEQHKAPGRVSIDQKAGGTHEKKLLYATLQSPTWKGPFQTMCR